MSSVRQHPLWRISNVVTRVLSASDFQSTGLNATASASAILLQKTVYNKLGQTLPTSAASSSSKATVPTSYASGTVDGNPAVLPINGNYNFTSSDTTLTASFNDTQNFRYQIINSAGQVIADNYGTSAQQIAFSNLTNGGLTADSGSYTVHTSYAPGSAAAASESQNKTTATTSSTGNVGASFPTLGTLKTNETQLTVNGAVTQGAPNDYYNFTLDGSSFKASFTSTADLRYQVLDSTGKVIADNYGTADQQAAYKQINSSTGYKAAAGKYIVHVTYAPGTSTAPTQNYQVKLYSGTSFHTSYETSAQTQTKASQLTPTDNTDTWATADAGLNKRNAYNTINAKTSDAINIGWLSENSTALKLVSQLTNADNYDYYSFTFQTGTALKLNFNNTNSLATQTGIRIQLYDLTGTYVVADSGGTTDQKKAYADLTSSTGLKADLGEYLIKVSYDNGANKSQTQNYNFVLSSGNYYKTLDQTTAGAQSGKSALLNGNYTSQYNTTQALATYLNGGSSATNISSIFNFTS